MQQQPKIVTAIGLAAFGGCGFCKHGASRAGKVHIMSNTTQSTDTISTDFVYIEKSETNETNESETIPKGMVTPQQHQLQKQSSNNFTLRN